MSNAALQHFAKELEDRALVWFCYDGDLHDPPVTRMVADILANLASYAKTLADVSSGGDRT